MRRLRDALAIVLILAASALFFVAALNVRRTAWLKLSFSQLSLSLIGASAVLGIVGSLAWWYVPMGRRPHSVPMWNDIYHRRGARAVRATSMAVSWGVMMTAISWMITSALLPKTNAPTTRVIDGGLVIDKWPGT